MVKAVSNYLFQNTVRPRGRLVAPQSPADSGHRNQFSRDRRSFRTPRSRMLVREVDAGDLDDGLPRGFLAGAIVEVWVALRLNWA